MKRGDKDLILKLIKEIYKSPPEVKVAESLLNMGYTEEDFSEMSESLPSPQYIAITNAMREIKRQTNGQHVQ